MRGVGMGLPYRQRFQFLLELIYGETFKPKAFWARHPDPDEFFYALFRVAKPDLERNAFVGDVFELSSETLHYVVNAQALERLGITTEELLALFKSNAAVEHPQEQKPKASAGNTSVVFVPTPTDETGYNPNIPDGWRPAPTRGKRDRGSKGHSGFYLPEQALKVVGQNAPVRAAKSNKCLEQQKASIASGKVDVAATAVNATNQNKKSGTSKALLRDETARAQKLLGIEHVLKGMSNDLEQCLDDDDVMLRSVKDHLAKLSEIVHPDVFLTEQVLKVVRQNATTDRATTPGNK